MSGPYSFQSQGERNLWNHLVYLRLKGEIGEKIQIQDHVYLPPDRLLYIADFKIFDNKLNASVWAEYKCKNFETVAWIKKRDRWRETGPGVLRIYGPGKYYNKIMLSEEITPKHVTPDNP